MDQRRHPRLAFVALACLITWALVLPLVAQAHTGLDTGIPSWWHVSAAAGPWIAAWIVLRALEGKDGVRRWLQRWTHWRVSFRWWGVAIVTPFLALGVGIAGASFFGNANPTVLRVVRGLAAHGWTPMSAAFAAMAFGTLEEPGWRGFLLPSLRRSYGPIGSTARLIPLWAVWHVPFFLYILTPTVHAVIVGLAAVSVLSVVLTWLVEESGSVLIAGVWQALARAALVLAAFLDPAAVTGMIVAISLFAAAIVAHWWLVPRRAELARQQHTECFGRIPILRREATPRL